MHKECAFVTVICPTEVCNPFFADGAVTSEVAMLEWNREDKSERMVVISRRWNYGRKSSTLFVAPKVTGEAHIGIIFRFLVTSITAKQSSPLQSECVIWMTLMTNHSVFKSKSTNDTYVKITILTCISDPQMTTTTNITTGTRPSL